MRSRLKHAEQRGGSLRGSPMVVNENGNENGTYDTVPSKVVRIQTQTMVKQQQKHDCLKGMKRRVDRHNCGRSSTVVSAQVL